ncbi:MAG TPA: archease [Candidatus Methylomirabilis sp.]|nr:archease [Candidatus Methylomirabilis sp.]
MPRNPAVRTEAVRVGGYRFLEDVAIADVAFEAWGVDLADLLSAAGEATFAVMADLAGIPEELTRRVRLEAPDPETLLFAWLEELIYRKDVDAVVFSRFAVKVTEGPLLRLEATCIGAPIRQDQMRMRADVKAVTYHLFSVERGEDGWRARVVLDI